MADYVKRFNLVMVEAAVYIDIPIYFRVLASEPPDYFIIDAEYGSARASRHRDFPSRPLSMQIPVTFGIFCIGIFRPGLYRCKSRLLLGFSASGFSVPVFIDANPGFSWDFLHRDFPSRSLSMQIPASLGIFCIEIFRPGLYRCKSRLLLGFSASGFLVPVFIDAWNFLRQMNLHRNYKGSSQIDASIWEEPINQVQLKSSHSILLPGDLIRTTCLSKHHLQIVPLLRFHHQISTRLKLIQCAEAVPITVQNASFHLATRYIWLQHKMVIPAVFHTDNLLDRPMACRKLRTLCTEPSDKHQRRFILIHQVSVEVQDI